MANPDHIAQLMKGVAAWNEWRLENPDTRPDLRVADLSEAVLKLSWANLSKLDLRGADLSKLDLSGANLYAADFSGALLSGALLSGVNLYKANLIGANLYAADLCEAVLSEANLTGQSWWEQILRALISPAVASTAHPRGV